MITSNHKQVWHTIVRGKAHSGRVHEIEQYIRDDADAASAKGLTETGKCVPSTKWRADDHASKYCKKYLYHSLKPPVISAKRSYRRRQWWSSSLGWEVFSKSLYWRMTTRTTVRPSSCSALSKIISANVLLIHFRSSLMHNYGRRGWSSFQAARVHAQGKTTDGLLHPQ